MELKTAMYNGKKVKLYPAFRTEAHAHDIEFRRNRLKNEIWDNINDPHYDEKSDLIDSLDEILNWISFPVTYLPYPLYKIAKETIAWAGCTRGCKY